VSGRRELTAVVLASLAGAGLVLVATRQTWVSAVIERPAPFPAGRAESTGAELRAWVPALAWTALAGAGALLATRGVLRRLVGGLLVLAGAGAAVGALTAAAPTMGWPVVAAAGGLVVGLAGAVAAVRGGRWPAMGARYERRRPAAGSGAPAAGEAPPVTPPGRAESPERFWEALDRGEDPTDQ